MLRSYGRMVGLVSRMSKSHITLSLSLSLIVPVAGLLDKDAGLPVLAGERDGLPPFQKEFQVQSSLDLKYYVIQNEINFNYKYATSFCIWDSRQSYKPNDCIFSYKM